MNVYTENGFESRRDYLTQLAREFSVPFDVVAMMAGLLGPNEDFDGLVTSLEDYVDEL